MFEFLMFLFSSLLIMIFLECNIKDKYFNSYIRKHYFRILKNIFNILVIIFIFIHRTYILPLHEIGNLLIISCIMAVIFNIIQMNRHIQFLKKEKAL
ncbi:hypothetical protein BD780_000300 [Clostridium tetanomorphum]|uniref:Uncharacterized protein n=1 Tax=Clostridium tetanomorphum TaxID=1553 RepID=A0A923J278_CLOTT|nr:hypothetical protein [Clostridium tetanomorphum]KAJ49467.1 hypothetical protein CTM_22962 [Clostridium tetanomorphum DSM 665]KAJ52929.1 hypothetical protein CTM_04728 [Clostridium tetanomorphum DSM 665]MBC2398183.1 hypothetical protein [Clostridium tetanomorphum]MBP1864869.1 hypothetical protein [Clostridium tetanomorphum]NRS83075.1 hypothetical protein [Clostridium tetanomorphum]